jgi:hypothetical protein
MMPLDHFRHDFPASRLQWPLASAGHEPHAFVFVAAENDVDPVARDCVMERGARVFGNKSEESFPPVVIGGRKDLVADLLELFNADSSNGFGDGFATLFVKVLKIEFFECHKKYWVLFWRTSSLEISPEGQVKVYAFAKTGGSDLRQLDFGGEVLPAET